MHILNEELVSFYKDDFIYLENFFSYHGIIISKIIVTVPYIPEIKEFTAIKDIFPFAKYNTIDEIKSIIFYMQDIPVVEINQKSFSLNSSVIPLNSVSYFALERWLNKTNNKQSFAQIVVYGFRCLLFSLIIIFANYFFPYFQLITTIFVTLLMFFLLNNSKYSQRIFNIIPIDFLISERWSNSILKKKFNQNLKLSKRPSSFLKNKNTINLLSLIFNLYKHLV